MRDLVLLPSLTAELDDSGRIGITGKFLSGVHAYVEGWDGRVRVLIEGRQGASGNLDDAAVDPATLPFELKVVDYTDPDFGKALEGAGVVHGGLGHRQNALPQLCAGLGLPFVTASEYTLRTRRQIVRANTRNPLLRVRRELWEYGQEKKNVAAISAAAGIQCNGTPTYDAYRSLTDSMLYFDTRTKTEEVVEEAALERRLAERVLSGKPLRLAFSGRLDPMKGAHHLPPLAAALKRRGVAFEMSICGGGTVVEQMKRDIDRLQVGDVVTMRGVLDFRAELVPFVREEVDVFVCPHVQGDPSCTYMETFALGVPIVGYDNEAFQGLVELGPVGWLSPLGDVERLADRITWLDCNRESVVERSRFARTLAQDHTMERTFTRRLDHLRALVRA